MPVTLFTDLNCPFCYATEQRLERLGVSDQIAWRGVEHEPELPVPMVRDDLEIAAELAEEVRSVRSRAPEAAIAVPPGKANTAAGLLAAAAALRADPSKAPISAKPSTARSGATGATSRIPRCSTPLRRPSGSRRSRPGRRTR